MFYTYLSKQWHKFPLEVWPSFFMLHKHPSLSTGEIPPDLCIEFVRSIYDKQKADEQTKLEHYIMETEDETNHLYATWQALDDDDYESEYRSKEAELEDLRNRLTTVRSDDILTNPDSAYLFLTNWHRDAQMSEKDALEQVVSWFETIKDVSSDLADSYIGLLQLFFETNNLRYIAKRNGKVLEIAFNPAFIASEHFLTVKDIHCDDSHLKGLYADFETNFGGLYRNKTSTQARSVVGSSSHLVEALANKTVGLNGKSLSIILKTHLPVDSFPHAEAQGTLSRLYSFFSDYPGIRHGGTATSVTRSLSERDAFLFGSLSVLFADYLSKRECSVCGGDMNIDTSKKQWICSNTSTCTCVVKMCRQSTRPSFLSKFFK